MNQLGKMKVKCSLVLRTTSLLSDHIRNNARVLSAAQICRLVIM